MQFTKKTSSGKLTSIGQFYKNWIKENCEKPAKITFIKNLPIAVSFPELVF